ncbi:hypothetical protein Tco_1429750 [Tanacetum coccineum]
MTIQILSTRSIIKPSLGLLPLPPLPTRSPVPPPSDSIVGRLALWVLILGGIIYTWSGETWETLELKANSPVVLNEPEGSDDYTEVTYDKEQCLSDHYTAPVTPPAYTPSISFLATMEPAGTILIGDEFISTIPARETDEFIKSSVDDFMSQSQGVEEFEDISSLDLLESTPVIDESSLLVTPLLDPKQIFLREVERFDPFFSLTQSGEKTRVMETPSFGFHHMSSLCPAAYLHLGGGVLLLPSFTSNRVMD